MEQVRYLFFLNDTSQMQTLTELRKGSFVAHNFQRDDAVKELFFFPIDFDWPTVWVTHTLEKQNK